MMTFFLVGVIKSTPTS